MEGQNNSQVAVVMVPFPAQGHLNQLLHLSRLITSYSIPVHYAGSTTHNHQAKVRVQGWDTESLTKIQFHDFQLPPYASPPPKPDLSVPFPVHLQPLFDISTNLRKPVSELLDQLSVKCRRIIVVYDSMMASVVQDVKFIPKAEPFRFVTVPAFSQFFGFWGAMPESDKPFRIDPRIIIPRVKDRGMVVREWAPQLDILGHRSIGGFMSHCGWNSCIESISMGVPIAAWPMYSDQPLNAILITEMLRIGVMVRDWEDSGKLVSSAIIESVIKTLMTTKEGEEIRKRASELGGDVRKSVAKGGATSSEMDAFIAHITR